MKYYIKSLTSIGLLGLILTLFIGCDKEFIELDSGLINRGVATNFNIDSLSYNVVSYTDKLGPVQTNGAPLTYLGQYNDPTYGRSNYSFVSQLSSSVLDPDFGDNTVLDSVILYIPYFSEVTGIDEDNQLEYQLDSVYGDDPFKLSIYENTYFLREFDPSGEFNDQQAYYSNKSSSPTDLISEAALEGPIIHNEDVFEISSSPFYLTNIEGDTTQVVQPGMRIKLSNDYWQEKIINQEGSLVLSNPNNFNSYFRGIYFKAEPIDGSGSLIGFNLSSANANIVLHYTRDSATEGNDREQSTYALNFGSIITTFIDNNFTTEIPEGDAENGDARLYLKGGEGGIAGIKLFDGVDENGVSNFEKFKNDFANYTDGEFDGFKRLINEANLVFYVDQDLIEEGEEPNRLYLYDRTNGTPLADYFTDILNSAAPEASASNHLGVLEREDGEPNGKGIRYKMIVTSHIRNLIQSDSTNVELGLAVSINVNLESNSNQGKVQDPNNPDALVPLSSIVSPRGTVIHGGNSEDDNKRLFLEIFYTCIDTEEDCISGN